MATTAITSNIESNDLMPSDTATIFSGWIEEKGKYFCEAAANISFYLSRVPTFYGHGISQSWDNANRGLNNCKKIMAFPTAIKGAMVFYDKVVKGGELLRNLAGDVCYIIGDTIDGFTGVQSFGIIRMTPALAAPLARIKDLTGVLGLGNTVYNLTVDMDKLRKIDLNKVVHREIKETKKGLEFKKNSVNAEIDAKWYDRLRCMTSISLCVLGTVGAVTGALISPWVFAMVGTVTVYGKYNMYASKVASTFWQNRYAELMPTQLKQNQLVKSSK